MIGQQPRDDAHGHRHDEIGGSRWNADVHDALPRIHDVGKGSGQQLLAKNQDVVAEREAGYPGNEESQRRALDAETREYEQGLDNNLQYRPDCHYNARHGGIAHRTDQAGADHG